MIPAAEEVTCKSRFSAVLMAFVLVEEVLHIHTLHRRRSSHTTHLGLLTPLWL